MINEDESIAIIAPNTASAWDNEGLMASLMALGEDCGNQEKNGLLSNRTWVVLSRKLLTWLTCLLA